MLDLGIVQSFWGPEQDRAVGDAGIPELVDFIDLMPSRYGQLNTLAERGKYDIFNTWRNEKVRIKGLQGFFYGTQSSLSRNDPGFSTAQAQVMAAYALALRLDAEFLILGSPSSRERTASISELDIRSGYLELSQQALDAGVPLLIENLPASFVNHGLSNVESLLAFARSDNGARGQIGICLDLGNHFSHHPGDRIRAFSEARELLETGLVRHMQINLLGANSLSWCLDFLRKIVDQSSLNLGLAIEIPDAGFEAGIASLLGALEVLRPAVSSTSQLIHEEFLD